MGERVGLVGRWMHGRLAAWGCGEQPWESAWDLWGDGCMDVWLRGAFSGMELETWSLWWMADSGVDPLGEPGTPKGVTAGCVLVGVRARYGAGTMGLTPLHRLSSVLNLPV